MRRNRDKDRNKIKNKKYKEIYTLTERYPDKWRQKLKLIQMRSSLQKNRCKHE